MVRWMVMWGQGHIREPHLLCICKSGEYSHILLKYYHHFASLFNSSVLCAYKSEL